MGDKTFKIDNVVVEAALTIFGKQTPQMHLPGMEPFGPFDLWAVMGCYSLVNPKRPGDPVTVTLTDFLEVLDFSRTLSEALGHYRTFPSDDYTKVRETLHRLFTVEAVYKGEWKVKTGRRGRPRRQVVEYHFRVLTSYMYIYPPDVIPPDQLPESKRRNVNRAKTLKNEPGPPVWELVDGPRPQAIQFRINEELVRGIAKEDPNIGATILPIHVFKLRRRIPNRDTTTIRLLLWVCRQADKSPKIGLDKLVDKMGLSPRSGERNRETILRSLRLLTDFGVIRSFDHEVAGDMLTIVKDDEWHFPARIPGEDAFVEGEKGLLK